MDPDKQTPIEAANTKKQQQITLILYNQEVVKTIE